MPFHRFAPGSELPGPVASPATTTVTRRRGFYRNVGKRAMDMALVLLSAPIVVPLVGALAVAVARDGGSPFFSQIRVGKDGRRFRMWKLRSMTVDAEARLADHLEADPVARQEWDETQKLRDDPRVTRVGRLLRRSSMDELPQLWNVLKGDMSLVGPRPMMPCQQSLYPCTAYYAIRPGITGYWQTSERNNSSFAARAQFDRAYERDLSLRTDLSLLWRTIGVVFRGTGC
ncbi:MAG: sugar transferase [Gemmobacter sp.]